MLSLTSKQKEYWNNANCRWNVKCGATRSGKTFLDYYLIPKRIRSVSGKDGLFVFLGNTKATLQRNIIEPLQNIWGDNMVSNIRADNTAFMFGEKVHCIGADKINQVNRLRGSSIKYCYGDEIVTWNEEVFNMLKSRLDKEYSMFDGTCNPEGPYHWFKKFIDRTDIDLFLQNYTIYDNSFLPDSVKKALETEYANSVYFDRYILGKWAIAEGLIYSMFNQHRNIACTNDMDFDRYRVSVDYGTQNPTVFLLFGRNHGKWYGIKEYYYSGRDEGRQKTDSEFADDMIQFIDGIPYGRIIIDPSAASFIAELKKRGLNVKKARNDVVDGIRFTGSLFAKNELFIDSSMKNTFDEINAYSWDSKVVGIDKPIKENDHCMDAMRYFTYTELKPGGVSILK